MAQQNIITMMKWIAHRVIAFSSTVVFLSACVSDETKSKNQIDVNLQLEITQPEPQYLRVQGVTNLPDDFVMEIFVCRYLAAI